MLAVCQEVCLTWEVWEEACQVQELLQVVEELVVPDQPLKRLTNNNTKPVAFREHLEIFRKLHFLEHCVLNDSSVFC